MSSLFWFFELLSGENRGVRYIDGMSVVVAALFLHYPWLGSVETLCGQPTTDVGSFDAAASTRSPSKIDYRKKDGYPYSKLSTGGPSQRCPKGHPQTCHTCMEVTEGHGRSGLQKFTSHWFVPFIGLSFIPSARLFFLGGIIKLSGLCCNLLPEGIDVFLGVDSPNFSTIVLFKSRLFLLGFLWFPEENRIPEKNGNGR